MAIDFNYVFSQWESIGVYTVILPFLLVFALVFGILSTTNILGKDRGVIVVIAFAVSLLGTRYIGENLVGRFFETVFPRFAILLTILLILVIAVGLFITDVNSVRGWFIGLGVFAVVAAGIVIFQSFDEAGFVSGSLWDENWPTILLTIAIIVLIIYVSVKKSGDNTQVGAIIPIQPIRNN